ncbi:MAG: polysaccharide deacetylase family protein, partial [Rhizobiales bacterium]|nr:polysaccharide deacetylase family protein [Hyphomicrobiales bacterium]
LTFDDGPGPYTHQILNVLAAKHVHATFCQIGMQVGDFPDTEKRILALSAEAGDVTAAVKPAAVKSVTRKSAARTADGMRIGRFLPQRGEACPGWRGLRAGERIRKVAQSGIRATPGFVRRDCSSHRGAREGYAPQAPRLSSFARDTGAVAARPPRRAARRIPQT